MAADDVTIGELARGFADFRQEVRKGLAELKAMPFVTIDVYTADKATEVEIHRATNARVSRIESTNQWLFRTLMGTILGVGVTAIWGLSQGFH